MQDESSLFAPIPESARPVKYPTAWIDYLQERASWSARQIGPRMHDMDYQDVRQELILHVLRQLARYDCTRAGYKTFITFHVSMYSLELIRSQLPPTEALPEVAIERDPTAGMDIDTALAAMPQQLAKYVRLVLAGHEANEAVKLAGYDNYMQPYRELQKHKIVVGNFV